MWGEKGSPVFAAVKFHSGMKGARFTRVCKLYSMKGAAFIKMHSVEATKRLLAHRHTHTPALRLDLKGPLRDKSNVEPPAQNVVALFRVFKFASLVLSES